jgi:glycosyltransferase involved in cell wall biosynthesis
MAKSIAIVSPSIDFVDGQALVTKESLRILREYYGVKEFFYKRGFRPIDYLKCLLRFIFRITSIDLIYIVISRSSVGQFRDLPFLVISLLSNRKIFIHVHGNDFVKLKYLRLLKYLDKKRIQFICCTNEQYVFFRSKGFTAVVVNNFVDQKKLVELGSINRRPKSILFFSNLIFAKGPVHTILAARMLNRYGLGYKLQVVGNVPEQFMYKGLQTLNQWKDRFQSDEITILGPIYEHNELKRIFSRNEIFCFPSFYPTEANPLALIEAACNGMKIVVNDRPIFRELLSGYKNVVYIKNVQPSVIADAIMRASELSLEINDVESLRKRYDVVTYESRLIEVIK